MKTSWQVTKYPVYFGGKKATYPNVPPGHPILSGAVKVGNLIFLGQMSGRTLESSWEKMELSDNLEKQVEVSLDKVRFMVEEAGSSMNNFVSTTLWLKDFNDYPSVRKAETEYYKKHAPALLEEPPVSNVLHPVSLAYPLYKEEIGAIAVVDRDRPGWEMKKYGMGYGDLGYTYPDIGGGISMISRSAVVGNLIFISGTNGRSSETGEVPSDEVEDQMVVALDKIRFAVEEAGSSMNNLIKITICVRDFTDIPRVRKAELEYYERHAPLLMKEPPISGVIQPASLAKPDHLIEIEAMAVVDRDRRGWEMKKYATYDSDKKRVHTRSVVVGKLILCSGVDPRSPETGEIQTEVFEEQMTVCLDKMRFALEEAGSPMNNMIRLHMHVKSMEDYARMRKTELEYYQRHAPLLVKEPPASGPIQLRSLSSPDYLIELALAMAVMPE